MEKEKCFKGGLNQRSVIPEICNRESSTQVVCCSVAKQRMRGRSPIETLGDDKLNNNAFTLIELLVVVLIIGILAAVALPQYKLAVGKARLTQLVTLANSVVQAQERYYLANGKYADSFEELDIDISGSLYGNGRILRNSAGWSLEIRLDTGNATYASDTRLPDILLIFPNQQGKRACYAVKTNQFANALCKTATGKSVSDTSEPVRYIYYF